MKTLLKISMLISALMVSAEIVAQSTLPSSPESVGIQPLACCTSCPGSLWQNMEDVDIADNQYADVQLAPSMFCFYDSCYWSRYLTCNNFNFSIPSGALISGIELHIVGHSTLPLAVSDVEIRLAQGLSLIGNNMGAAGYWSVIDSTRIYGNSTNMWGTSLWREDVEDPGFGVYIKVGNNSALTPSVMIDEVTMTITYMVATEIISQTQSAGRVYASQNKMTQNLDVVLEKLGKNSDAQLVIYNLEGKECFSSAMHKTISGTARMEVSTAKMDAGIYLIRVITPDKIYDLKTFVSK